MVKGANVHCTTFPIHVGVECPPRLCLEQGFFSGVCRIGARVIGGVLPRLLDMGVCALGDGFHRLLDLCFADDILLCGKMSFNLKKNGPGIDTAGTIVHVQSSTTTTLPHRKG